jgi:hypothetical protein
MAAMLGERELRHPSPEARHGEGTPIRVLGVDSLDIETVGTQMHD